MTYSKCCFKPFLMLTRGRRKHYLPLKALSLYAFVLFYCFEGVCGDCGVCSERHSSTFRTVFLTGLQEPSQVLYGVVCAGVTEPLLVWVYALERRKNKGWSLAGAGRVFRSVCDATAE